MISQKKLKELLWYDPESGKFHWRESRGRVCAGQVAGALCRGYVVIRVDGILYRAHRLAWLYYHGKMPANEIDHINRDKSDNRICNLRAATSAENKQNLSLKQSNKSGVAGVCFDTTRNKWAVNIRFDGRRMHVGRYDNFSEAVAVRKAAERKYHKFNTGA